jgi:glycosyltransferase involved in cell wall biosynthesis
MKILMCSEASFLSSGFAIYAKELLSRLHSTNKYEIAEFASYGLVNDPKDVTIKWRYYANAVGNDDPRHKEYTSRPDNQFGRWRFEKVLLDFKPDVVIDVRDYWMSHYQATSPLRKYFHWILMPTVDSAPQQESWLDTYLSADAVFTYSDWGAKVLLDQTSNQINYIDTAAPGVDLETFKPVNDSIKRTIKQNLGLPEDSVIVGSVMRNQKRKLIPDLLISFRKVLDNLKKQNSPLYNKTFLYLHTSYPDIGWDIPELLKSNRLSNRVFFTYSCKKCNDIIAKTFCGPATGCQNCMEVSCAFPTVTRGISSKQLASIYNIFDYYVQYAICEGAGMPQVEAGASGLPILTVDYSAMVDIIEKLGAQKIKVQTKFKELETKAFRAYPDNDDLADKLLCLLAMSSEELDKIKTKTRKLTEKYYNWDDVAKKWEAYLDKLDAKGFRSNWDIDPRHLVPIQSLDKQQINGQYFDLLINICNNHLHNYQLMSSMFFLDMLKDLDYGFVQSGTTIDSYGLNNMEETISTYIDNINNSERVRHGKVVFNDDYLEYARIKGSS